MRLSFDILRNTNLNIHVIGASAVEGSAIARFLFSMGAKHVTLHDFCENTEFNKRFLTFHNGVEKRTDLLKAMKKLPYEIHFADSYLQDVEQAELIFLPQAWYKYQFNFPKLSAVVEKGDAAISTMVDLCLQMFPGKTIGVTGTHGKTTVTRLITHILKLTGRKVFTAGNERHSEQLLSLLAEQKGMKKEDFLVLEISNRQLKIPFEKYPDIAVITNVYPNHLDEHESMDEYRKVKMKIAGQGLGEKVVVGGEDTQLLEWAQKKHATVIDNEKIQFVKTNFDLPDSLAGEHNMSNVAIAFAVCEQLGLKLDQFQVALSSFPGVEKRQEVILKTARVQVINDSIATTPTATLMAVKTFQNTSLFLIMGGDDKNIPQESWDILTSYLDSLSNITVILLPGTISNKFTYAKALRMNSLEEAFIEAQNFVLQQKSLVTILLSPGGEAFYTKFLVGKSLEKMIKDYFSSSITLSLG